MLFKPLYVYYRTLGPRGRAVLFQLPLSVTMLLVTALTLVLHPVLDLSATFLSSLGVHLFLLVACALVPWGRLPAQAVLVIPVLDCLAIGVTREAADQYLTVLGFLLVFPVVWLASDGRRSGVLIGVFATILSAILPPVMLGTGVDGPDFIRIVLLPIILGAVALTTSGIVNALSLQRQQLEAQSCEVRDLLAASEDRERLLQTVMDTVSVGVCAIDDQGRVSLMNHHLSSHLGRTITGVPTPEDHKELPVYGADRKHPLPIDRHPASRAARGESFTDELIWSGNGTGQRAYSATSRLIQDSRGKHRGAVLAFTDVTELVEALSAKDQFVSSVSHELRTPLTSILGYLDLALDEEDLDPEMEFYLTVAKRNGERLLHLVGDLLTIASDALTIEPRDADLTEVVRHSVQAAQPKAAAAGITLELLPRGAATGYFDPDRLGQAVDNLVSNAIKYTPSGGTVTVKVGASGNELRCEVADTGVGMNEEELDQAFTRFFRAANAHSSTIPGAGLGLAITRSIMENHRGHVALSSSPGEGTTAVLTLPAAGIDVDWNQQHISEML
ncbi:ATP-binding protein [Arthrobacter sp. NQ7]|uniref:PAS domain-containing sensor histidine kinase n=1 Tax=Arthrobacter sp. NQ7 TaxID=3032303 RepID=UPI00241041A1|nr:PAS domain-containing sensor histidine kinase [Arthrobacter sp. NQ7]MDJ0459893.1 ATP-binding protein [Arthrobacter sp. NQ7]